MYLKRSIRQRLVDQQRRELTLPRFQISMILLLTGFVGFLTSFLLLHAGMSRMWIRYPLAISAAYIGFLLLLRLWLAVQRYRIDSGLDVSVDFPIDGGSGGAASPNTDFGFGGGGDAGGGGAGGSWGDGVSSSSSSSDGGGSAFDAVGFDVDLEELGLIVVAIAALIGGLVASLYVVYIAPILLAEVLVDGLLLRGLHRRVGNIERKHWLQTAIRKTLLPAVLYVTFFGVAGGALQMLEPEAKSAGEVWTAMTAGDD